METNRCKRLKIERPTVFKGVLENCCSASWNLEDWANACGDATFKFRIASKEIGPMPRWENEARFVSCTIRQFVDKISCNSSHGHLNNPLRDVDLNSEWVYTAYNYMIAVFQDNSEMLETVNWGAFGLENRDGKDSTLWIGTCGSHTPCHQDSYGENLVAQMYGRKLWILFSPEDSSNLYPTRIPYEESSIFSSVSILNPDYDVFPKFSKTKMFAVVVEPGDVLYVPPKWWHYVHCIDTAISVNTWIETERDNRNRLEEAVVRMLATALLPTYRPGNESWINHNEELMSAGTTASTLSAVLKDLSKGERTNRLQRIDFEKAKGNSRSCFAVEEISRIEMEHLLDTLSIAYFVKHNLSAEEQTQGDYALRDIINCILHPNVIENIVEKLTQL